MSTETAFAPVSFPALHTEESRRIEQSARVAGHAAGYAAGLAAGTEEAALLRSRLHVEHLERTARAEERLTSAVTALETAAAAYAARVAPVVEDAQDALAEAVVTLSEILVGVELADDERSARSVLARALDAVQDGRPHAVRLHPADLAAVELLAADHDLALTADPALERGDAIVEFDDGIVDARLRPAIERARRALGGETP